MKEVLRLLYNVAEIIIQILASILQFFFPSITIEATGVVVVLLIISVVIISRYVPTKSYRR